MNPFAGGKETIHRILDAKARDSGPERAGNLFLAGLIVLNVLAVILETVRSLRERFGAVFGAFDAFSVAVFTLEYLLRLWSCTADPCFRRPVLGRLRYLATPMALVDLVAIVPAYLPGEVALDLRYARAIRLVRMLRVLKIGRYSRAVHTLSNVFRERRGDLALVAMYLLLVLVVASATMYFTEHAAQPEAFSSIPAAMWWAVMTLTTVGYGDVYPVTTLGKVLGGLIALLGVGVFAVPAAILASAFSEELEKRRKRKGMHCPHCGRGLDT